MTGKEDHNNEGKKNHDRIIIHIYRQRGGALSVSLLSLSFQTPLAIRLLLASVGL